MDAQTLSSAMGGTLPMARYEELLPAFTDAMRQAGCTTVERAAMWCAQVGHESGGLQWMEEIASGAAYEWRTDLGNVNAGDGVRFKGRGPIQVTGRYNYGVLSKWAHGKGLVPSPTFFVDNPRELASARYGFMGAVWYWTTQRDLNGLSDRRDIEGATRAVNGGTNGLPDRRARYARCLGLGERLLGGGGVILRARVEATKNYLSARNGLPYGYGGQFSDTNLKASTDCSGLAYAAVAGCLGLPMNTRYGSTEALRKGSWENGNAGVNKFGLVHAGNNRNNVPADAVVKLGLQHGGGGMYSHVACTIDGVNAESRGNPGGVIYGSVVRGGVTYWARAWNDNLFHDFWYLPGPIAGELDPNAFPLPVGHYYGWYSGPANSISGMAGESKAWIDGLARAQEKLGVPVTRKYDAATNKAIADFQRANNFALVDGFLGAKTWPLLFAAKAPEVSEDLDVAAKDELISFIKGFVGPIGSDVKDIRQQLTGGRDAGDYSGWEQLGKNADGSNRTVVDSIADLRARVEKMEKAGK